MADGNAFLCAGLGVLGTLGLYLSHRSNKRRRLIAALPTSQIQGVFIGLVELKGTAESEAPVTAYLSEESCVLYSWSVHEHWRREVEETYRDEEGRTRTRTRIETGTVCVASGGESAPFYVKDETGVILVHPDGAEQRPLTLFSETCSAGHPIYFGKGPPGAVPNSTLIRTFSETGIPLHAMLFLVGRARERRDMVAPEVADEKDAPLYLLTTQSEQQVLSGYKMSLSIWAFIGLASSAGCGAMLMFLLRPQTGQNGQVLGAIVGSLVYVALAGLSWIWMVYNSLVDTRNRVRQGWSQLEIQLQRRHDLIPQLIACVESLTSHENEVQSNIAKLRNQQSATAPGQKGADFHGIANDVSMLAERYPVLIASNAFTSLQHELITTEQRIALARAYFNDIATAYNTRLEVFPDIIISRLTGFSQQPLLMAEDFERAEVKVHLAD